MIIDPAIGCWPRRFGLRQQRRGFGIGRLQLPLFEQPFNLQLLVCKAGVAPSRNGSSGLYSHSHRPRQRLWERFTYNSWPVPGTLPSTSDIRQQYQIRGKRTPFFGRPLFAWLTGKNNYRIIILLCFADPCTGSAGDQLLFPR